jgi:hypothetical protein
MAERSRLNIQNNEQRAPKKEKEPDFSTPPFTNAERAEEKRYKEALKKDKIISGVRTRVINKK